MLINHRFSFASRNIKYTSGLMITSFIVEEISHNFCPCFRVLENASDMATTLIGTPYYMSPELFSNKPYNHKVKLYLKCS